MQILPMVGLVETTVDIDGKGQLVLINITRDGPVKLANKANEMWQQLRHRSISAPVSLRASGYGHIFFPPPSIPLVPLAALHASGSNQTSSVTPTSVTTAMSLRFLSGSAPQAPLQIAVPQTQISLAASLSITAVSIPTTQMVDETDDSLNSLLKTNMS